MGYPTLVTVSLDPFALPERYRLERGIAAGGMASVYAAHDTVLDRPVAVKVLADHLNDDVTARARFEREARAAASLSNHPGVVTIFDVGEFGGRAFIVMERREGGTIDAAGRVDQSRALAWLRTVAEALDAAHERGIVHRDIKPGNLLLDERGNVAVADFGIASLMNEAQGFTATGEVLGTAAYLSPEQAAGEPATPASDRYALAVVAYELLTGEKPFVTQNFAAAARAHIEEPPPDAPGLPRDAQSVLKRGLAKVPAERWETSLAFVEALSAALPMPAAAPPPPSETARTRVAAPTPDRPPQRPVRREPAPSPLTERPGRRTGTMLAVLSAALVAAAAVAIALSGGGGDGGDNPQAGNGQRADREGNRNAQGQPSAEPTSEAPADPTAEPTPDATTETQPVTAGGDPSDLNADGFALFEAGDYASAIPLFEQAVEACGDSTELDPCGYALYNLGASLNRAGRPDEAIPILEERLERFGDNASKDVKTELKAATKSAP